MMIDRHDVHDAEGVRPLQGRGLTPWVKICGMTNLEDALVAAQAGADAVGFIFVPTSPRAVARNEVEEILAALPSSTQAVGVVADESPEFLKGLLRVCPFKGLQFHGDEPPEEVLRFKGEVRLIKAIRVKGPKDLERIPRYQGVDAVLLDTHRPGRMGGTGESFDWKLAQEAKQFGIPIIVAGGLSPQNVADCIRQAQPYGVDVVSGVERSPGKKDPSLVREFILNSQQAHF